MRAAAILGEDFARILERDGWAPYRRFEKARHQICFAHLLRRSKDMISSSYAGAARVPHAVRRLLMDALQVRDHRNAGAFGPEALAVAVSTLEERADELLSWRPTVDTNRRLLKHLSKERDNLFTFLKDPGVAATNHRAERAIRPAVVTRKVFGGNRTPGGARVAENRLQFPANVLAAGTRPDRVAYRTAVFREQMVSVIATGGQAELPLQRAPDELVVRLNSYP